MSRLGRDHSLRMDRPMPLDRPLRDMLFSGANHGKLVLKVA